MTITGPRRDAVGGEDMIFYFQVGMGIEAPINRWISSAGKTVRRIAGLKGGKVLQCAFDLHSG